jgi:hypothetical protein
MTQAQIGAAIALAIIGFLLIVVSAVGRDSIGPVGSFGDRLTKIGIAVGGLFLVPLPLMLAVTLIAGGR